MAASVAVLALVRRYRAARTPIVGWALKRTLGSLRLLFPLASRALPMLLVFVTFLFINAEVWQVTTKLDGGLIWDDRC